MVGRVGAYIIEREIGRGGMGVVYLARDERLDRPVAIKALPDELASDPVRLERFEREGKAVAQLNHPNVAGIYGVEEQEGQRYLILEYVEGETLGDRLDAGPIPIDEALEFAVAIAAGLEAAHEVGVIHRDLKPDNVKITPDGKVKVLDFGLAKTVEASSTADPADSPTLTTPRSPTIPGAILGTAAYMSPEQARGRRIDKRSDIWSFGVLLYEMLAGSGPFAGETANDSIGAVLHKDVDLDLLPEETPLHLRRVLERCLVRDKALRYRDIGDVRIELLRGKDEPATPAAPASSGPRFAAVAILAIAVLAAVGWYRALDGSGARALGVRKFDVMQGSAENPLKAERPRISPDGTRIAFVNDDLVHVRDFSSFEPRAMPGTDGATTVFWSPDGKWIGYTTDDAIYKVALLGGGAVKVADADSNVDWDLGGGWTKDDRIIFREDDYLAEVAARGGNPQPLLMVNDETEVDFHSPTVIPDSGIVLFIEHRRTGEFGLAAYNGDRRVVLTVGKDQIIDSPTYSPTGHVLFVRGFRPQSLWAIGFDPKRMEVTSEPFLVLPDASNPSVAGDGTLLVHRGARQVSGQLVFAGVDGVVQPIGDPLDIVITPMLSPDETRIAFSTGRPGKFDVWVHDLERGSRHRVTFTESLTFPVAWSSDGTELAVVEAFPDRDQPPTTGFYAADGSGQTRASINTGIMSLDAEWNTGVGADDPMARATTLTAVSLDEPSERRTVLSTSNSLPGLAVLNPAGTLMAYASRESGDSQVYCTRFPDGTGKWQVSIQEGRNPIWSSDGASLYFESTAEKKIYAVEVETDPSVRFGMPQEVLDAKHLGLDLMTGWCVTADGQRFVTLQTDPDTEEKSSISVIENWYEEYRER